MKKIKKKPSIHARAALRSCCLGAIHASLAVANFVSAAPREELLIKFSLDEPGIVTVVVEDGQGRRVMDLLRETALDAGEHSVAWDGYDNGVAVVEGESSSIKRTRIKEGTYTVRGIRHGGIKTLFREAVYSPGSPPWFTQDGSGAWLSDHTPPADLLVLPPGNSPHGDPNQPQLLITSQVAEAGHALVWATTNGKRLYGTKINGWTGAFAAARDNGTASDADAAFYAAVVANADDSDQYNGAIVVHRVGTDGRSEEVVRYAPAREERHIELEAYRAGFDLAVHDGLAVLSDPNNNRLVLIDIQAKRITGRISVPDPTGLAFDLAGRLVVLSAGKLRSARLDREANRLNEGKTLIAEGLERPRRVLLTSDAIYVSDWGQSHQVKVFGPEGGKLARSIGTPGGPQLGKYDPTRMHHPLGMAVTPDGRLWVAENDFLPKRVSVWDPQSGDLLDARYGPPQYGGGGMIDPKDPSRLYLANSFNAGARGGMEFRVGIDAQDAPVRIYHRGPEPRYERMRSWEQYHGGSEDHQALYNSFDRSRWPWDDLRSAPPARPIHLNGRQYMTNAFNGPERHNYANGLWLMTDDGIVKPVASSGPLDVLTRRHHGFQVHIRNFEPIREAVQGMPHDRTVYIWSDLNGDGFMSVDEMQFRTIDGPGVEENTVFHVDDELAITTAYAVHLKPTGFTTSGVPLYDLKSAPRLIEDTQRLQVSVVDADDGRWVINSRNPDLTGWRDGAKVWSLPTYHHNHVPTDPGQLIAVTRPIGPAFTPREGQSGPLVALSGEKGTIYLITADGLLLHTLGGDIRTAPHIRFPEAKPSLDVSGHSFEDEHFHPTITQVAATGEVRLVAGKHFSGIFDLEGFDTVRRFEVGKIEVTSAHLRGLPEHWTFGDRRQSPRWAASSTDLTRGDARDANWVEIDPGVTAAFAVTGDNFVLRVRTPGFVINRSDAGESSTLFGGGWGVDLMLGTDGEADPKRRSPVAGDVRMIVTRVGNQPVATLYRPVVANKLGNESPTVFESPVGRVPMDEARDVSDQVKLLPAREGDFIFSVPLALLGGDGWQPAAKGIHRGDVGLLRGDGDTTRRSYWADRTNTITTDIPAEARLRPASWGEITFGE